MVLVCGIFLSACAIIWMTILMHLVGGRLSLVTTDLCEIIDHMIDGSAELIWYDDSETLLARISHRLMRLYEILQENRRQALEERQKLQMLVSDISHQIKTPVSNLRMVTDTLLTNGTGDSIDDL